MVVGHADVRGPEKYNLALSERRAELVKNYLVSQGIAADKIETRAEGKDQATDRRTGAKAPVARHATASKMDDEPEEGDLACVQPQSGHHS